MKFSIIVPVYNTEKYLKKCLDSILSQTISREEMEIIVVNDGSTDHSESIIKEYKKRYPKLINYIKKENGGLSSARNVGIDKATGEYLLFIDSDDYIESNLLATFREKNKNYDLFIFGYNMVYDDNLIAKKLKSEECLKPAQALPYIIENDSVRGYAWNKIFKKEIIDKFKLRFEEEIKYIEDLSFAVTYLYKCKNIFFSTEALYNYVQRSGSLINSSFNASKLSALKGYDTIRELVSKNNCEYLPTVDYFIFEINYELSVRLKISNNFAEYYDEFKVLKSNMKKQFKLFIFKKVKLKYKLKSIIKLYFYNLLILKYGGNNGKN